MSSSNRPTESDEFTPEHYQAIGQFVTVYGMLESLFHEVFVRYSALSRETCRALMGGMRLKDVIDRTKRIMKINNVEPRLIANFEHVETLLNPLSTFRDKIIHRVWLPSEAGPLLMNLSGAKSKSAISGEVITTEEIESNSARVQKLMAVVIIHALVGRSRKDIADIMSVASAKDRETLSTWLEEHSVPSQQK